MEIRERIFIEVSGKRFKRRKVKGFIEAKGVILLSY
jgi:hypothetical protein